MQIEFNSQGYIQGSKPEYKKRINKRDKFIPVVKDLEIKPLRKRPDNLWKGFRNYAEECKRTELLNRKDL